MTTEQGQKAADAGRIEYRCELRGRTRRTEVEAEADGILTPRDTQQIEAVDAYPAAREPAAKVAKEAWTVNEATLKDLRCGIDRDLQRKVRRVWKALRKEIEKASPPPGCQRPPCNADESIGDETLAALAGRVAWMRYEATALDTYFETLVDEQTALTERVTAVKSDADALADEVRNATPDADLVPFYAPSSCGEDSRSRATSTASTAPWTACGASGVLSRCSPAPLPSASAWPRRRQRRRPNCRPARWTSCSSDTWPLPQFRTRPGTTPRSARAQLATARPPPPVRPTMRTGFEGTSPTALRRCVLRHGGQGGSSGEGGCGSTPWLSTAADVLTGAQDPT
jgi:hypothetical protein